MFKFAILQIFLLSFIFKSAITEDVAAINSASEDPFKISLNMNSTIVRPEEIILSTTPATTTTTTTTTRALPIVTSSPSSSLPTPLSTTSFLDDLATQRIPLWELIYPDGNASTEGEATTQPANLELTTLSTSLNLRDSKSSVKYIKLSDQQKCERYFGECLRQILTHLLPKLKNGNKELQLESLDPFYINHTSFQLSTGPLIGDVATKYAMIYGLTQLQIKKLDYQLTKTAQRKFYITMNLPKIHVQGLYKGNLKMTNLALRPKGEFNITLWDLAIKQIAIGDIYHKDGHKFLKLSSLNVTSLLRDCRINATGIFPEERLNTVVLDVVNQYWREIFNIILPESSKYWVPILISAFNSALSMVPFDFLIN